MQGSKQFKQALLESLLLGLRKRAGGASRTEILGFHERKRAIRLAADAALVNARGADAARWTRTMKGVTELDLAHRREITPAAKLSSKMICERVLRRTRRSYRRRGARKASSASGSAGVLARAMVRKRTRVLRGIVPGGEELDDESTLLCEALDYAVCLKAQVDVMQLLVRALQAAKP